MAFFSVVIPLHNKATFVSKTIESVLNQAFDDFEIIVVNDGSTDNSLEKVEAIKDSKISIYSIKNQGVSIARNFGIDKSTADYICFLDADDLWKPTHLSDLKQLIENFPNCGMYCTGYEKLFLNKTLIKSIYFGLDNVYEGIVPDYFLNSLVNQVASGSSVAVPRHIFDTVGVFDQDLRSGQDTDLWIRIALKHTVAFTSKVTVEVIFSGEANHLSTSNKRIDRVKLLYKFKEQEKTNISFKKYMDMNRFSIALERKLSNDTVWKSIIKDIDYKNLNWKQKLLLKAPKSLVENMKKIQAFLIKNNIYLSPFK